MWRPATSLASRVGRRGAALLFFTLLDLVYCLSLLTEPRPLAAFYTWMARIAPLPVWAAVWGAVGLICLWYATRVYDTPAFVAAVSLKVGWGMLSFFGWAAGAVSRGYVSAVVWLGFGAFVALIAGGIPPAARRPPGKARQWIR